LSEIKTDPVETFFRYTIPGIIISFFFILSLPFDMIEPALQTPQALVALTAIFAGGIIASGWMLYFVIYPVWRSLLETLNLFPKSPFLPAIEKMMIKSKVKPEEFWSFFLWNYCRDSIRERVKNLANFGHSLYIASLIFILFAPFYAIFRLALNRVTILRVLLEHLLQPNLCNNLVPAFESMFLAFTVLIGLLLLYYGKKRIQYAWNTQLLLFRARLKEIEALLKRTNLHVNQLQE
jgi:hypothetical protein